MPRGFRMLLPIISMGVLACYPAQGQQCSLSDSAGIIREISADTTARPGPTQRTVGYVVTAVLDSVSSETLPPVYLVPFPLSANESVFRFAVFNGTAYRIRGWACNNIETFLANSEVPDDTLSVWRYIFAVGAALNPVGLSTKIVDSSGITGLPMRIPTIALEGVNQPTLRREGEGWHGKATFLWAYEGYHRLKTVNLTFRVSDGELVYLTEESVGSDNTEAAVLLDRTD